MASNYYPDQYYAEMQRHTYNEYRQRQQQNAYNNALGQIGLASQMTDQVAMGPRTEEPANTKLLLLED